MNLGYLHLFWILMLRSWFLVGVDFLFWTSIWEKLNNKDLNIKQSSRIPDCYLLFVMISTKNQKQQSYRYQNYKHNKKLRDNIQKQKSTSKTLFNNKTQKNSGNEIWKLKMKKSYIWACRNAEISSRQRACYG